jgi:hypothetical protein
VKHPFLFTRQIIRYETEESDTTKPLELVLLSRIMSGPGKPCTVLYAVWRHFATVDLQIIDFAGRIVGA